MSNFEENQKLIDEAKQKAQMIGLLKRASDSLQSYWEAEGNHSNESLSAEIDSFLKGVE